MVSDNELQATAAYANILVPLDGSSFADGAIRVAQQLAGALGARLHTLSVAGNEEEAEELRKHAQSVVSTGEQREEPRVLVGQDAAAAIGAVAAELEPCLVCMATHGRGRVAGAVLGSVANSVLRAARRPILVVGPRHQESAQLTPARVVACVDGSAPSEAVLPIAAAWARKLTMTLVVATVAEPVPPPVRPDVRNFRRHGPDDPEGYVARLSEEWRQAGLQVNDEAIYDPISPAEGIRTYLDDHPAALVALTTHARTGMRRVALGSAASSIVHASPAPVLTVPLPD